MNHQVMDFLAELQDEARDGEIQAFLFIALSDDDVAFGHTDLDEDQRDMILNRLYDLAKDLEPTLDS